MDSSRSYLLAAIILLLLRYCPALQVQQYNVRVIGQVTARISKINITGHTLSVSTGSQNHTIHRFLGVPFARPDGRRFDLPNPLDYDQSRDVNATSEGPLCFQAKPTDSTLSEQDCLYSPINRDQQRDGEADGSLCYLSNPADSKESEDCLYLNIRTPDISGTFPVLVMLSSAALTPSYGDVFVATQHVVMVTVSSREGVLGYLSLVNGTNNIGLQDQRLALKFINDSISYFGGDRTRITLGGHGSAAAAVGLHAVAVESRQLFHRVAMLGGSISSPLEWSISLNESQRLSSQFIERLNCSLLNETQVLECLREKTISDILSESRAIESETGVGFVPIGVGEFFSSVTQSDRQSDSADSADSADSLWRNGIFTGAVLTGASSDSGRDYVDQSMDYNIADVDQRFRYYPRFPIKSTDVGRSFVQSLVTNWPDGGFSTALLGQAIGDFRYICPVWEAASDLMKARSSSIREPVFVYRLEGGGHFDDAQYFLGRLLESNYSESQRSLSLTMMTHLAQFVNTSVPNRLWRPFTLKESHFMNFATNNLGAQEGGFHLEPGRCPFWKHEMPFLSKISYSDGTNSDFTEPASTFIGNSKNKAAYYPIPITDSDTILGQASMTVLGFGRIEGHIIKTRSDVTMTRFRGIRYAKPPLGELRFAKPEPPITNSATQHTALKMPPLCMQINPPDNFSMSEDCLFLNLWTPRHSRDPSPTNLPVIVFFHGGFFSSGGIADDRWRGSKMLNHEKLVVVTVNYRLGVFGFLSLSESLMPENLGLWDQELAIDWVSKRIESFGGSRSKVTLMGVEAGAVAISYHMTRNTRKFQRAIMLTGSPFMSYPVSNDTNAVRSRNELFVINELNCSKSDTMRCLRNLNACIINEKQRKISGIYGGIPMQFPPVIDGSFLTSDPMMLNASNLDRIPLLIGTFDSPGKWIVPNLVNGPNISHSKFLEAVERVIEFFPRFPTKLSPNGTEAVKRHYTEYNEQDNNIKNLALLLTNRFFISDINRFLDAASAERDVYSFRLIESINNEFQFDDAYFAFGNPATQDLPHGQNLANLSKTMVSSFVAFGESGEARWKNISWPPFKRENRKTLIMSSGSVESPQFIDDVLMAQESGFWDWTLQRVDKNFTLPTKTTTSTTMETTTVKATVEATKDATGITKGETGVTGTETGFTTDAAGTRTTDGGITGTETEFTSGYTVPGTTSNEPATDYTRTRITDSKTGITGSETGSTTDVTGTEATKTSSDKINFTSGTGSPYTQPLLTNNPGTGTATVGGTSTIISTTVKPSDPIFLVLVIVLPIFGAILLGLGIFVIVKLLGKNTCCVPNRVTPNKVV